MKKFSLDDIVHVELHSISKETYDYYNTLSDIIGGNMEGSSAPANPTTNLNNGALGYFGAFAISSRTIVIE